MGRKSKRTRKQSVSSRIQAFQPGDDLPAREVGAARAEQDGGSERVVVRVAADAVGNSKARRYFKRLLDAVVRFDHPALGRVREGGTDDGDGRAFLVEDPLPEGASLRATLDVEGVLPPADALAVARDLLNGLAYAHHAGVVHGGLSPDGVWVAGQRGARRGLLVDYGFIRVVGAEQTTPFGVARVDLDYAAPEVIKGEPVDPTADVYSVGVLLFESLTGRHPIPAPKKSALLRRLNEACDHLPANADWDAGLAERLDAVIRRATAKDPGRRFPSARAFLRALRGEDPDAEPNPWALPADEGGACGVCDGTVPPAGERVWSRKASDRPFVCSVCGVLGCGSEHWDARSLTCKRCRDKALPRPEGKAPEDLEVALVTPEEATAEETTPESQEAESPEAESPEAESPEAEGQEAESQEAESPVAESPVAESPVAESPVAESPVAESPVAESPVAESPVAESPVAESPVAESPETEEASDAPAAADSPAASDSRRREALNALLSRDSAADWKALRPAGESGAGADDSNDEAREERPRVVAARSGVDAPPLRRTRHRGRYVFVVGAFAVVVACYATWRWQRTEAVLVRAEGRVTELTGKLSTVQGMHEVARTDLARTAERLRASEGARETLGAELTKVTLERGNLQKELGEVQLQAKEFEQRASEEFEQNRELKAALTAVRADLAAQSDQLSALRGQLEQAGTRLEERTNALAEAGKALGEVRDGLRDREAALAQLQTSLATAEAAALQAREAAAQAREAQGQAERERDEAAAVQARLAAERGDLAVELEDLKVAHTRLRADAFALEAALRDSEAEARDLRAQADAAATTRAPLELYAARGDEAPAATAAPEVAAPDQRALLCVSAEAVRPLLVAGREGRALVVLHVQVAPADSAVRARVLSLEGGAPAAGITLEGPLRADEGALRFRVPREALTTLTAGAPVGEITFVLEPLAGDGATRVVSAAVVASTLESDVRLFWPGAGETR